MAKKKESLSFKERLNKSLVPDFKWLYKIPENWAWTRLGNIDNIKGGKKLP